VVIAGVPLWPSTAEKDAKPQATATQEREVIVTRESCLKTVRLASACGFASSFPEVTPDKQIHSDSRSPDKTPPGGHRRAARGIGGRPASRPRPVNGRAPGGTSC